MDIHETSDYHQTLSLGYNHGEPIYQNTHISLLFNQTSSRGRLWWPALGVVKTLHTDNKQHKENMKT